MAAIGVQPFWVNSVTRGMYTRKIVFSAGDECEWINDGS